MAISRRSPARETLLRVDEVSRRGRDPVVDEIRTDMLASMVSYSGAAYHGTPVEGAACIALAEFRPSFHMIIGGEFVSISRSPDVAKFFRDSGTSGVIFTFMVRFHRVWRMPVFYLDAIAAGIDKRWSGWWDHSRGGGYSAKMAKARRMGLLTEYDGEMVPPATISDEYVYRCLPRDVEAVIVPRTGEAELAVTKLGCRALRGAVTEIQIGRRKYSPDDGWSRLRVYAQKHGITAQTCAQEYGE